MWYKCSLHVPMCIFTSSTPWEVGQVTCKFHLPQFFDRFIIWEKKNLQKLVAPFFEYVSHGLWKGASGVFQFDWHNIWFIQTWFGDLTSSGVIKICQNPNYKSSVENHCEHPNWFKTFSIRAWEKNPALFENSTSNSFHKFFGYHLFSLTKSPYKHTLMHFYTFFPNPPMLVFVNSLWLPPNKIAIHESCDREVVLGC
jgi:hypothetical protein